MNKEKFWKLIFNFVEILLFFFTAVAAAKGVGGHTGGAYDTVPEVMILDAFFRGVADKFVPISLMKQDTALLHNI